MGAQRGGSAHVTSVLQIYHALAMSAVRNKSQFYARQIFMAYREN